MKNWKRLIILLNFPLSVLAWYCAFVGMLQVSQNTRADPGGGEILIFGAMILLIECHFVLQVFCVCFYGMVKPEYISVKNLVFRWRAQKSVGQMAVQLFSYVVVIGILCFIPTGILNGSWVFLMSIFLNIIVVAIYVIWLGAIILSNNSPKTQLKRG